MVSLKKISMIWAYIKYNESKEKRDFDPQKIFFVSKKEIWLLSRKKFITGQKRIDEHWKAIQNILPEFCHCATNST
jgi:hypothetical protein